MNISRNPPISDRYAQAARRELAETLRNISDDCDLMLESTGCPLSSALKGLADRQSHAEACFAALSRPYQGSASSMPISLVSLGRNKDKTAHKVQMLHTLAPIRQANFDRFEASTTGQETQEAYARICQTAQQGPRMGLDPVDD